MKMIWTKRNNNGTPYYFKTSLSNYNEIYKIKFKDAEIVSWLNDMYVLKMELIYINEKIKQKFKGKVKWCNGWFTKAIVIAILSFVGWLAQQHIQNKTTENKLPKTELQKDCH